MTTSTVDQEAPEEVEPFHIVYSNNDQGPSLDLGICVNAPLREFIRENKIEEPYLLVLIRQGRRELQRKLEPLTKGLTHITFNRPGRYTAEVMVVYPSKGLPVYQMKKYLLATNSNGTFSNELYGYAEEEPFEEFEGSIKVDHKSKTVTVHRIQHVSSDTVTVREDSFAEPPAAWRATVVRWFYPDNDKDQCHLRRRSLWSIPLVLVVLPLHYLLKLFVLMLYTVLGLLYGINIKPIWRPYRNGSMTAVFGRVETKQTMWFSKRSGPYNKFDARNPWWNLSVIIVLVVGILTGILTSATGKGAPSALQTAITWVGLALVAIALLIAIIWFASARIKANYPEWIKNRREKREADSIQLIDRQLATMSCETQGEPITIKALKHRRRFSPVVVYNSAKDAVCKPYMR